MRASHHESGKKIKTWVHDIFDAIKGDKHEK